MFDWDLPDPFILPLTVTSDSIDDYQHVNNAEYVRWLEQISWAHSAALGLDLSRYQTLNRAMAVVRHEIDYLAAAHDGEPLMLATWIVSCDGRLSLTRRFQLIRCEDHRCLLRGQTRFACIELSSGRPRRMPEEFTRIYQQALCSEGAGLK